MTHDAYPGGSVSRLIAERDALWAEVRELRATLAAQPQADELLAIVTELAEVDPRRFTDVAPLVDVAKAATAGSATPTGDDDDEA